MGENSKKTVSLKTVNTIMIVIAVIIVIALLIIVIRVQRQYSELRKDTDIYIDCLDEAPALNRGSDYLTQQARSFVVTGQLEYLNNYFEEVNVTRRRNRAIEFLEPYMQGEAALDYLQTAMDNSNDLMEIEYYAMVLEWNAAGYAADGRHKLPEELKGITLSAEDAALSADDQHQKAISVLFDNKYQNYKDNIAHNVDLCLDDLMRIMASEQHDSYDAFSRMMIILFVMIVLLLLVVLAVILISLELVTRPMLKAASYIRNQQIVPVSGASEMQFLAEAYNDAFEKSRKKQDDLQKQAQHDALTGLLNRTAYEELIKDFEEEQMCLLLVDIDKFKGINDTYGHDVGDLVLKKVASVLRHQFRANDLIFRFGGDEYAVIMRNAGPQLEDLIKLKVGNANRQMAVDEKLPEASLSVGAVFGSGKVTEELFKAADTALYTVKDSGGRGVAFGKAES